MDTQTLILIFVISATVLSLIAIILILTSKKKSNEAQIEKEMNKLKTEINNRFEGINRSIFEGIKASGSVQTESLKNLDLRISELRQSQEQKLEKIRETTEQKLAELQKGNQEKLNEIQNTVDEKLQKTLNERVSESFQIVSKQLEEVYKSMGEMQNLASGVGNLTKILSNVKTRGIFGEIQLSRILEQILTQDQYETNVITKKSSQDRVEFAVKLPAKNPEDKSVLLPIDAKFPMDHYNALIDAGETGNKELIDKANKLFEVCIKKNAKDIHDKYIDPPNTTDFAIMFLPTESLYAEVAKRTTLIEELTRSYSVNVAGPSTISALLNSLQMGFRTLAIEKRSHEVWSVLSAVRTEFENFGSALSSVQKRLKSADDELDKLVGTRTRMMMRKLKDVQTLPSVEEAQNIIGTDSFEEKYNGDEDVE